MKINPAKRNSTQSFSRRTAIVQALPSRRIEQRHNGLHPLCRLYRLAHEGVAVHHQILDPVAHSLAWSSLIAALPLLLLFVMLGALRGTAWVASLVSLALAIVLAILGD